MSNLKLPSLKYADLDASLGKRQRKTIAYMTTIERVAYNQNITLLHHGTPIATISPTSVHILNSGYDSVSTSARQNRALVDNVPKSEYRIAIRKGVISLCRTIKSSFTPDEPLGSQGVIVYTY